MGSHNPLRLVRKSIIVKISLVILLIESTFLAIMGVYYYKTFSHEIDSRLAEKMRLPGALMSQMALNFEAVTDYHALEDIIEEHVIEAFITKGDGTIFYSPTRTRIGEHFSGYLAPGESILASGTPADEQIVPYRSDSGGRYLSILSPLKKEGDLLGFLYIRIQADRIKEVKDSIILVFLFGSIVTIALTTLIEAFFVHRLFVPRIKKTVTTLRSVAEGDYTARVFDAGAQDQIGMVVKSVNSMIEQIEMHTMNLQALTQAGEDLAAAGDAGEIYKTVVSIITGRFPVMTEAVCPAAAEESPGQESGCRELVRLDPLKRKIILSGEILCAAGSANQPTAPRGERKSGRGGLR